ncbi:MAG: thioredoxin family protein [Saprospiraceae bacterium]|nr:thioredoxin family protein [Saprospiraceae bacterium]
MKWMNLSMITLCFVIHLGNLSATQWGAPFRIEKLAEARRAAEEEHKLVFVSFYADWCAPCNWMEKTTFRNQEVLQVLDSQFVSVKIDIDSPGNKELCDMYSVKYLPTMFVLNTEGEVLARVEETISPRKLLDLLSTFDQEAEWQAVQKDINSSPPTLTSQNIMENELDPNLFTDKQSPLFRLQVGVFSQYDGAAEFVSQLQLKMDAPVIVMSELKEEQMLYRVYIGQFLDRGEAESFRNQLRQDYQMASMIRTL